MPTTLEAIHVLNLRLQAGSVDTGGGIIRGSTVAKAGVRALGKYVLLDAKGNRTLDEKMAKKKLPVFTDEKTLETLLAAAAAAGGRVKSREDHDDRIQARAGFTDNFQPVRDGDGKLDRVIGDVHLFDEYANRALVLETAVETPEQIGLSIDMVPYFDILPDRALMRIATLDAVDIVDAGAITPDGLLLSVAPVARQQMQLDVDTSENLSKAELAANDTTKTATPMAEPTLSDLMTAVTAMSTNYAALAKTVADQGEALKKFSVPAAPVDADKDGMKAVREELTGLKNQLTQMRKEKALLGFRGSPEERAKLAQGAPDDIEKIVDTQKTYLQAVEETVAKEKCSRVDAHTRVQRSAEGAILYKAHLSAKGVTKMNMAA